MTNLLETLRQIEAHAQEWLDFSQETYGWNTREYGEHGDDVRCYFADSGNHRSVRLGRYGCRISVGFFSPVQFSDLTYRSMANAETLLATARELLAAERQRAAQRTESEVQSEKAAQIESLRKRLAELEGGAAA